MAKDRNSFAKRQREVEKKRKATEKRERRAQKKPKLPERPSFNGAPRPLSPDELTILSLFRANQMTPGSTLDLSNLDLSSFRIPLYKLTEKRLLVAERGRGGYSLTESGFAAMHDSV